MKTVLLFLISLVLITGLKSQCSDNLVMMEALHDDKAHPYNYKRHEFGLSSATVDGNRVIVAFGGRGSNRKSILYYPDINYADLGSTKIPFDFHHFQAHTWRDSIIVGGMGFFGGFSSETPAPQIAAYYIKSDSYASLHTIPFARRRGAASSVLIGDWLYFFGGARVGHRSGHENISDRLNLANGSWESLPNDLVRRDHAVAIYDGSQNIYIAGGRRSKHQNGGLHSEMVDSVTVFNTVTNTFSYLTDLPTSRAGLAGFIAPNELGNLQLNYYGGEHIGGVHTLGEGYDLSLNTWSVLPPLTGAIHASQFASFHPDTQYIYAGAYQGSNEREGDDESYVQRWTRSCASIFPVEFLSLSVDRVGDNASISFKANEFQNKYFEIQKRDRNLYVRIGSLNSKGDGLNEYNFIDTHTKIGSNIYRIKQIDYDGSVSYSSHVEISIEDIFSVYPNPISESKLLKSTQSCTLFSLMGQKLLDIRKGDNDISTLEKGIYIIRSEFEVKRIIVQ